MILGAQTHKWVYYIYFYIFSRNRIYIQTPRGNHKNEFGLQKKPFLPLVAVKLFDKSRQLVNIDISGHPSFSLPVLVNYASIKSTHPLYIH
jgi:hypothetical protein